MSIAIEIEEFIQQEEKFTQLREAREIQQNRCPKIQKVAPFLRERENFAKYYLPRLVSFGPIHHGEKNLKVGEKYKLTWAAMYIDRTKQTAEILYQKIVHHIKELKDLFTEDAVESFPHDEELCWMLFVDGCSLVQILDTFITGMNVKIDVQDFLYVDVFLLENQLPFQLLKLLSHQEDETKLIEAMDKFVRFNNLVLEAERKEKDQNLFTKFEPAFELKGVEMPDEETLTTILNDPYIVTDQVPPTHLLHHLHRAILREHDRHDKEAHNTNQNKEQVFRPHRNYHPTTYKNIQELKAAGISVKKNHSNFLGDISFSSRWFNAQLRLPLIVVDESTAPILINLIAYEMCPDFVSTYGISSHVGFLGSLVGNSDDVKELRSQGVLHNYHSGGDEGVANLFNTISADLVVNTGTYGDIRDDIEKHYRNKYKTWLALGCHTYFSNPWAIIAFLAAVLALVLSFIQTLFSAGNPTTDK